MKNDICIDKIINVYYRKQDNWERNSFIPRTYDCIVLFTEGKIEYNFLEKTIIAQKGDLLFIPGNIPYSGKKHSNLSEYFVIDFTCAYDYEFQDLGTPALITPSNFDDFYQKFLNAVHFWNRQSIGVNMKLKSLVYTILSELFKTPETRQFTTPVDNIIDYISNNLGNADLTVTNLCNHFFISESQLRRNLQKATGLKPNDYILTLRINKAKNKLAFTEKNIKTIAFECGFTSQYYFSRCFSQNAGISPSEYRKKSRTL